MALLADGTPVTVRELTPGDLGAVRDLHDAMSPEDLYLRFFAHGGRLARETAGRMCRAEGRDHTALGVWWGGRLAGVADYERTGPYTAELALAVADEMRHRGVGTLLLRRLTEVARARGVRVLRAEVLARNTAVLRAISAAGLPVRRRFDDGVIEITMPLTAPDAART